MARRVIIYKYTHGVYLSTTCGQTSLYMCYHIPGSYIYICMWVYVYVCAYACAFVCIDRSSCTGRWLISGFCDWIIKLVGSYKSVKTSSVLPVLYLRYLCSDILNIIKCSGVHTEPNFHPSNHYSLEWSLWVIPWC